MNGANGACSDSKRVKWFLRGLALVVSLTAIPFWQAESQESAQGQETRQTPDRQSSELKVVCWNVLYGFNHGKSVEAGVEWIQQEQCDVLALQELNGISAESLQGLAGRWGHAHSAILKEHGFPVVLTSNQPIEVVKRQVEGFHHGYLHCRTNETNFFVVHFWPKKDHEAEQIAGEIKELLAKDEKVVLLGDFNTHSQKDAEFLESQSRVVPQYNVVKMFENLGMVDLIHKHSPESKFTCPSPITIPRWSADKEELESKRQRIDFVFADAKMAKCSNSGKIDTQVGIDSISDHYPVIVQFAVPLKDP